MAMMTSPTLRTPARPAGLPGTIDWIWQPSPSPGGVCNLRGSPAAATTRAAIKTQQKRVGRTKKNR
jgi:hypothetical protein